MSSRGNEALFEITVIVILIVLLGVCARACDAVKCSALEDNTSRRTKFTALTGCLVETSDGRWIPAEQLRDQ